MYFTKQERKHASFYAPENRYCFYTECSRGSATLTPFQKRRGGSVHWQWQASRWDKIKRKKKDPASAHPLARFGRQGQRVAATAYGIEPTLYRAAQAALQHLFTYRRAPLTTLMKMLEDDQLVYELSRIGGPPGG